MPIFASNFASNSLTGVTTVVAGNVTINLSSGAFALEGDKAFVVKLRKGSSQGAVVATSPVVTIKDRTTFVSLTANTATVAEGNLVSFSLVTTNVVNGATVYYSVLPATANVTADDFTGNTGSAVITNNAATFALKANADVSLSNEDGENFRVQLRTNSPTGNIVFATSNVTILDTYKTYNVLSFVENVTSPIVEGSNVTFTYTATNIPAGTILYYSTTGNLTTFSSNTGSFVMNGISNTFVISNPQTPFGGRRSFNAIVKSESQSGPIVATSNTINVFDETLVTLSANGGVQSNVSGYRIHTFTTSSGITFSNPGRVEYLIVAGGGGGSAGVNSPDSPDPGAKGSGGGAGGLLGNIFASAQVTGGTPYSILIGGGGAGGAGNHPFFEPSPQSAPHAGFRGSNTTALGFVAVGGGAAAISGSYGYGDPSGFGPQGGAGGSGGGGTTTQGNSPGRVALYGGDGITGQGNPGGGSASFSSSIGTGYGGGAGTAGGGQYGGGSPPFGEGIYSNISGTNSYYASGGAVGPGPWTSPSSGPLSGTTNTGSGGRGGNNNGGGSGTSEAGGSGGSGIVIIRYYTNTAAFVNITTPANFVYEGSNAVFTLSTVDVSNNTLLYYYTVGNILSSHFVTGNTGSFRTTQNSTTITLPTNSTIPANEERFFQLRIAGDAGTSQDPLITSNVFTVKDAALQPKATSIQYLVVAGGGGGGAQNGGGGGGAGGYLANSAYPITPATPYTITVGGGGAGAPGSIPPSYTNSIRGSAGGNSSIGADVVSFGGGGGGTYYGAPLYNTGQPGGSGGAGHFSNEPNESSQPKAGLAIGSPGWNVVGSQGYPSGRSSSNPLGSSGGGGGAGQTGGDGDAGIGGDGLQTSISGSATYYGGGGGGAGQGGGGGAGGLGGGGTSASGVTNPAINGGVNTGGGGSGMSGDYPSYSSGSGGTGIVIIRYPDTFATATTTGSPNVIYANANIIYRFWQSGSITFP